MTRGNAVVLGGLLAVTAGGGVASAAALVATVASLVRWGTASLAAA
ncbi:MAG: hypothetical protein V7636_1983, partial [Actinomycetota bacterium]